MRKYLDKTIFTSRRSSMERRIFPRYPLSAVAEIVESQSRTKMSARISDMSRGGCYAEMMSPFPLGDLVKMRIMKNKTPFLAQAEVTNTSCGMGMGLKFTTVEPEQIEVLEKWISELSGAPSKYETPSEDDLGFVPQITGSAPSYVVNEIIMALMRKGILSDQEGKTMIQKLLH
jgi:hypothetical protein